MPLLSVAIAIEGEPEARASLAALLRRDLERTPLAHEVAIDVAPTAPLLARLEVRIDRSPGGPRLAPTGPGGRATPGWLVHAALRAAEAVGIAVDTVDRRSSWIGQLVARSTAASSAPVPSPTLRLTVGDPTVAASWLAAIVRRLDHLTGPPIWEQQFLVAFDRVWLRRDLYWLGIVLWMVSWWRSRRGVTPDRPRAREFRWLAAAAWWIAPPFAALLVSLPMAATWTPLPAFARWAALAPSLWFAVRWAAALVDGARPVVSLVPLVLVAGALAAYVWQVVLERTAGTPSLR